MKHILYTLLLVQVTCLTLAAQWSTPITVLPNVAQPSYIEGDDELTTPVIGATTDQMGTMHVVWSDYANGINEVFYSSRLNANSPFSAPVNLSNSANDYSLFPDIVASPSGAVMVSWTEIDENFTQSTVQARMLHQPGTWGNVMVIEQPDKWCLFSSGAFTNDGSVFVVAYNEFVVNNDMEVVTQELGVSRIDFSAGSVVEMNEPIASPDNSAFRPKLLNQGADTIHCIWYDEIGEDSDYIKYVAYSALENGNWTAATPISQQSSTFLWDDGPLHLVLDKQQNLHAIWMSFVPLRVGQMAIKSVQEPSFGAPLNITDRAVFNGVFYFDPANKLNMLHPFEQGLTHFRMENDSLVVYDTLVPLNSEVYFPAVHTAGDTAHLFWAQNNELRYSTNIGVSNTTQPALSSAVAVFPTVSTGVVHVVADKNIAELLIIGNDGRVVIQQRQLGTRNATVHLEQMPIGRYVALFTLEGGKQVSRNFIIVK